MPHGTIWGRRVVSPLDDGKIRRAMVLRGCMQDRRTAGCLYYERLISL